MTAPGLHKKEVESRRDDRGGGRFRIIKGLVIQIHPGALQLTVSFYSEIPNSVVHVAYTPRRIMPYKDNEC